QCYLFPEVYKIYENSSPKEVLKIFYNGSEEFFVDSLERRAEKLGFTIHEVLTLASIVKGETNTVEEMPRIAGVYHNRLRIGMRLQADPTIQYILPGGWRRLLHEDLEIDSPYNTYRYAGLPPGPINNPGKNATLAVLYPEKHKYLYFVANGNGGHNFSRTLNEHSRKVKEYRRWVRSQSN
ncbi:MAG: endolytic transglycosylase MltG, partial [Bacteroidetes bacterium]|nr:endolytic transglycosylase MltG [Bacteroidota bacterium]